MTEPIDFQLVNIHVLHHMSYSYHFPDIFISDLVSSGLVDGFSQALHLASDDFPNVGRVVRKPINLIRISVNFVSRFPLFGGKFLLLIFVFQD